MNVETLFVVLGALASLGGAATYLLGAKARRLAGQLQDAEAVARLNADRFMHELKEHQELKTKVSALHVKLTLDDASRARVRELIREHTGV